MNGKMLSRPSRTRLLTFLLVAVALVPVIGCAKYNTFFNAKRSFDAAEEVRKDYIRRHEDPPVPNYGKAGTGARLRPGMVLAVEPMINLGGPDVRVLGDKWTAVTCDGKLSAHFEHSVAVTESGPEVLTIPEEGIG